MAQRRFHEWQDAVTSTKLSEKLSQMVPPGRYGGFNTFNPTAGTLNFGLQHTTNPAEKTDINPGSPAIVSNLGLMVSNQGVFIEEDAEITGLSTTSNAANAWTRYDVVYMEHEKINVVGGQAATYGVVQGTAELTIPALPDPTIQTMVGIIEIHKNETDLDNAFYHPMDIPTLGAENELEWENITLLNGWVAGTYLGSARTPQIARGKDGWVHLRGIADGSSKTDDTFANIPHKFLPNLLGGLTTVLGSDDATSQANLVPVKISQVAPPGTVVGSNVGLAEVDMTNAASDLLHLNCSYYAGNDLIPVTRHY